MIINYQKLNLKNKITVTLIGFSLIAIVLIYFIIIPTISDIQAMSKKIEEQKIDLEKKYIKGYGLRQLTENLKKIEAKLNLLDQVFINRNRELEFITALENEANHSQINQKINLSLPKVLENQRFQKSDLRLFTNGEFANQLKYLINLESLSYYINIKSLELSSLRGSGQAALVLENSGQKFLNPKNEGDQINFLINAETFWE